MIGGFNYIRNIRSGGWEQSSDSYYGFRLIISIQYLAFPYVYVAHVDLKLGTSK